MILITGGTGFIGRHVLEALLRVGGGRKIFMLVNKNKPDYLPGHVNIVEGGVEGIADKAACLAGVSCIIHLASKSLDTHRQDFYRTNVMGTANVISLAKHIGAQKIIYISSTGVYGHGSFYEATENTAKNPDTEFSKSKLMAEELLYKSGLPVVVLRHRFVIGEGDKQVIPGFISAIKKLPVMVGAGNAAISFIDVTDLAHIIVSLAVSLPVASFTEYHATNGQRLSIKEVFGSVSRILVIKGKRKIPVPFALLYVLVWLKDTLAGASAVPGEGLTLLRVGYLGRNNHFSNHKLLKLLPDYIFRTFEQSLESSKRYYAAYA